jgi:hypothetical protein
VTINFGRRPVRASFTLTSDADFFQEIITSDGTSYPGTASMTLKFLNAANTVLTSWTATFVTSTATIRQPKATVAALLLQLPVQGRVFYLDGGGGPELLIAQGVVSNVSPQ